MDTPTSRTDRFNGQISILNARVLGIVFKVSDKRVIKNK